MGEMQKNGFLSVHPDGTEIHIERSFAHPVSSVWTMLTEPKGLAQWLAPGTIELHEGGTAKLDFIDSGIVIDSVVTECVSQRAIAYSWSGPKEPLRPLRFALSSTSEGTCLNVILRVPKGEDAARAAAGFEAHLEMLAAALEGVPIKFPFRYFKDMRNAYQAEQP